MKKLLLVLAILAMSVLTSGCIEGESNGSKHPEYDLYDYPMPDEQISSLCVDNDVWERMFDGKYYVYQVYPRGVLDANHDYYNSKGELILSCNLFWNPDDEECKNFVKRLDNKKRFETYKCQGKAFIS
ncbi:MAG: hypothetical protein J7K68_00090 [Candidatus Diapherotrites archaeon]|nr:hypothetical protein [Candidatus Diapherotrites archaeon]